MANEQPERMNGASLDVAAERRARLKDLFPAVFTETKNDAGDTIESADFEKLKAELGTFTELFENRRERYGMDWPGKKDALRLIQTPSRATLKPCRGESVNFDATEHLFIEGDNLEVLKLLQKSYYGKVKMIYIDPPYNTGKEFIYPDNYAEDLQTYLEYAGLADSTGKKFSTNTANEGRFHTKWLNMMYPRLYLARNLLRDDGVIFISIDDNEATNLRKLCDEVFGEENFAAIITVVNNLKGRNDRKHVATCHEYLLVYGKFEAKTYGLPLTEEQRSLFKYVDERGERYDLRDLRKRGGPDSRQERPNMFFPIFFSEKSNICSLKRRGDNDIEIYPLRGDGTDGRWRWGKEKVEMNLNILEPRFSIKKNRWDIDYRIYLNNISNVEVDEEEEEEEQYQERTSIIKSFWVGGEVSTDVGKRSYKELMEKTEYDYPKAVELVKRIVYMGASSDDIILDFFAGSATTAHAVLDLNKQGGGHRKFILVQLPEPCSEDSETFKAGYRTIADIGKERIRRVIQKLNAEQEGKLDLEGDKDQDRGFRVLKLDQSNFKQWRPIDSSATPEQLELQLKEHIDHVNHAASQEALLFEILLKAGFQPTEKAAVKEFAGIPVFSIAEGALLICLAEKITKELIDKIIEANPQQFICLDSAFDGNDQLKSNTVLTFAAHNMQKEKHNQIVFKTV